jgi:hypothetical protein
MTGAPLLLSRSRSVSYWPEVNTTNLHLRPTLIVDDPVPKFVPDSEPRQGYASMAGVNRHMPPRIGVSEYRGKPCQGRNRVARQNLCFYHKNLGLILVRKVDFRCICALREPPMRFSFT